MKADHEYTIHRDSKGIVIVDPTMFIQRAPITLDFSEFVKEFKLQRRLHEGEDKATSRVDFSKHRLPPEWVEGIRKLLAPEYIDEQDAFDAVLKSYLAQRNIGRKFMGEYREGDNAGKKDFKIIGDYKKKRPTIG